MAGEHGDVRVLAGLERADAAVKAHRARRVQRDGGQRRILVKPLAHGQRRAHRQVLHGDDGMVGHQRELHARRMQNGRGAEALVAQLDLGTVGQQRPEDDRHAAERIDPALELGRNQVSLRAVLERDAQVKLLRQAQRREDVVRTVRVHLERQLAAQHGQQRLKAQVEVRLFRRVGLCLLERRGVLLRVAHGLAKQRRDGHACIGGRLLVGIDALGIFAQGRLHGHREAQQHLLHGAAGRPERGELPADHVGRARPGHHGRHAGRARLGKAGIERVEPVDGLHLGRNGVGTFVAVRALVAHAVLPHADVAVRVDDAGRHRAAGNVDAFRAGGFKPRAERGDLSARDQYVAGKGRRADRADQSVFQQDHVLRSIRPAGGGASLIRTIVADKRKNTIAFHSYLYLPA